MMAETALVERLRAGDETAFTSLVEANHALLVRLARSFVREDETAQEIAQESWLALLNGLDRFEGRSTLRSWLCAICVNKAKTRATRDARSIPFSALAQEESSRNEPSVSPDRFRKSEPYAGHWSDPPRSWERDPSAALLDKELQAALFQAIDALPAVQRTVILMRDVAGIDTPAVCNELGLSESNLRVLLHRARSKVRARLETEMEHDGLQRAR